MTLEAELLATLTTKALVVALSLSAAPLAASLVCGLLVSIFQAATQIQDQTLTFVPKLAAVVGALVAFGPWSLEMFAEFAFEMFEQIRWM